MFIGLVFSILAAGSCDFLSFDLRNGQQGAFGLFTYTNPAGSCTGYRNTEITFSEIEKTARVGAVGAPAFSLAAILLQLVDLICWRVCCGKIIESSLLLLAMIFQFLTFSAFGSQNYCLTIESLRVGDRNCRISTGGIFAIVAFSFYFIGGIVGCFIPEPQPLLWREHKHESDEECNEESSGSNDEESFESADDEQK